MDFTRQSANSETSAPKQLLKALLLITALANFWSGAQAATVAEGDSVKRNLRVVPLPAIFYTPETRLGLGAALLATFRLGNDSITRASNVQLVEAYTFNKQLISENTWNIFTGAEKYSLNGELSFYNFPILYYGVGKNALAESEELITYKLLYLQARALRQVKPRLFVGPMYRGTYLFGLSSEKGDTSLLNERPLQEQKGGINSGLGLAVVHDTRDNVVNARKGHYADVFGQSFGTALGSDYRYDRLGIDLRGYRALSDAVVLAGQGLFTFNNGEVPFREMALMGGSQIMRGYYKGRFRERNMTAVQTEVRIRVLQSRKYIPELGLVLFGALADVANKPSNLSPWDARYTVGGGLRIMVNKNDRVNIRIDYGVGKNTSGLYFAIGEAF